MRTWLVAAVAVVVPVGAGTGQPSKAPDDPPPLVIKPKGSADPVPAEDPPGKIIIRPRKPGEAELKDKKPVSPADKTRGPDGPRSPGPVPPPGANAPGSPNPTSPKPDAQADGKPLFDYWFAAAVEGRPIGYLHWYGREVERQGRTLHVGTKDLRFTVARFGDRATMFGSESTVESPEGEVVLTSMRQEIGRGQFLALSGAVDGKTLKVTGGGAARGAADEVPWPAGVVGLVREPKLFKENAALLPGETFAYPAYFPQVNRVVTVTVTFEGEQAMALWPNTPPRKLRRYTARTEPITDGKQTVKLPPGTTWVDAETAEPYLVEFKFAGLGGRVTFLRTAEAAATAPVANPPDLGVIQAIPLDREIPGIHGRAAVVYKVSVPDEDDDPATVFAADARQRVKNLDPKAKTFELHVSGAAAADAPADPPPGPEFLASNFYLAADDERVKAHAAAAVGGLPDGAGALDRARAVERWVARNMKQIEFSQAMATADNVARTLSGDCTECAMLAAAMCRAVGVPSRTAIGLVYAPGPGGKPTLAYHMWFEAYAGGRWVPLDATLGRGGVGPGHLKITDHSWHNEKSMLPLLPVLRMQGARPAVRVLGVTP